MNADQTITLNQNAADCIKSVNSIGSTTYQNICSGSQSVVPWGALDWTLAVGVTLFAIVFIGFFAVLFFRIATDSF